LSEIYKVKLGDIWLTSDGLENGRQCLLEILNISKLRELYRNIPVECVGGITVQTFGVPDVAFGLAIFKIYKPVGDLLVDLLNDSSATEQTVTFDAAGGGNVDFSFDCRIVSIDYKDTEFGWENVQINLIKQG